MSARTLSPPQKKTEQPMAREAAQGFRRIAILAIPGVQMLNVTGPMDVFHEANKQNPNAPKYVVEIIGLKNEPVRALNGTRFLPDASVSDSLGQYDTVLVAGSPDIREYEENKELISWLVKMSHTTRRLGSMCSGAFLLAHAGLLNGKRATTHWRSAERLTRTFPKIVVDPNPIYIKDGSVYSTAGVTASMDLALALVEEDHGRSTSLKIAKELILFLKRTGGQAQFSMHLESQISESGPVRDIRAWIVENLKSELSVETLAAHLGMSVRNFSRLFKRETQMTPADYVEAARVEAARRMLEEGVSSLKEIASLCGFSGQSGLRRAFVRRLNVTPAEYRQTLRIGDDENEAGVF